MDASCRLVGPSCWWRRCYHSLDTVVMNVCVCFFFIIYLSMPSLLRPLCFLSFWLAAQLTSYQKSQTNKGTGCIYFLSTFFFLLSTALSMCSFLIPHALQRRAPPMSYNVAPRLCVTASRSCGIYVRHQTLSICLCSFIPNDLFHFIRWWDRWWHGDENSLMLLNKWTVYESKHRMGMGVDRDAMWKRRRHKRNEAEKYRRSLSLIFFSYHFFLWSLFFVVGAMPFIYYAYFSSIFSPSIRA